MEEFRTSDLSFAAFLKTAQVPFIRTDREGPRVFFIFEKTPGLRDLKNSYFGRSAKVVAMTFAEEIRAMKSLTHMDY